jgi:ABC-type Fe3+-hydroxamate transport system substrate-binding protein
MKGQILAILNEFRQDMEGYSYYGSNFGVSEDDFEEIAGRITALESTRLKEAEEVIAFYADKQSYTEDKEENLATVSFDDLERANYFNPRISADDLVIWTGGKRARDYQKKYLTAEGGRI